MNFVAIYSKYQNGRCIYLSRISIFENMNVSTDSIIYFLFFILAFENTCKDLP